MNARRMVFVSVALIIFSIGGLIALSAQELFSGMMMQGISLRANGYVTIDQLKTPDAVHIVQINLGSTLAKDVKICREGAGTIECKDVALLFVR